MTVLTGLLALTLIDPAWSRPKLPHDLNDKEWTKLNNGEFIVKKRGVNKSAWPELTIYTKINASPKESMAIFSAFDHQKNYIPKILKSYVVKLVSPTELHTAYEMDMPWPLSNGRYVHGTIIRPVKEGSYSIDWYLVKSTAADRTKGGAIFVPYQKDSTIWVYKSFIDPKNFLAGLFKNSMIEDVQSSLTATKNEIYRAKKSDTKLLEKYIKILEDTLKGVVSYSTDESHQ